LLYNPEKLPLKDVVLVDSLLRFDGKWRATRSLGYLAVLVDGDMYWLPQYYMVKHRLIDRCPKCDPIDPGIEQMTIEMWLAIRREACEEKLAEPVREALVPDDAGE
jgi:hypothetical protein